MQVVSNTGPLLHLREIGELKLLSHVGRLSIPRAVQVEVGYNDPTWLKYRPPFIWPLAGIRQRPFLFLKHLFLNIITAYYKIRFRVDFSFPNNPF